MYTHHTLPLQCTLFMERVRVFCLVDAARAPYRQPHVLRLLSVAWYTRCWHRPSLPCRGNGSLPWGAWQQRWSRTRANGRAYRLSGSSSTAATAAALGCGVALAHGPAGAAAAQAVLLRRRRRRMVAGRTPGHVRRWVRVGVGAPAAGGVPRWHTTCQRGLRPSSPPCPIDSTAISAAPAIYTLRGGRAGEGWSAPAGSCRPRRGGEALALRLARR